MRRALAILLASSVGASLGAPAVEATDEPEQGKRYIVVLRDSVEDPNRVANEHASKHGFRPTHVYGSALKGYAARLSESAVADIETRPEVEFVEEDGLLHGAQAEGPPQIISTAVRRIDGEESSARSGDGRGRVPINVAVIDQGIDDSHPDLDVVGGTNCLPRDPERLTPPPGSLPDVHGTMVAGFIGALDNDIGRVGVAPGARLWDVEVLDEARVEGTTAEVVCGVDWVTSTRLDVSPGNDIVVANMSLLFRGGPNVGDCEAAAFALHLAVCRAVDAGVTVVAAAGNDGENLGHVHPATYSDVLTVTAMTDLDGRPGGLGRPTSSCARGLHEMRRIQDDSAVWWSNFAASPEDRAHTIAAPGVCVSSTYPKAQYATSWGTSFAAPLVSGTVALCVWSGPCATLAPRQIVRKIVRDAARYNIAHEGYGFRGDPLRPLENRYYGYLIRAGSY